MKQHDPTDCGAACLASVAAHYGQRVPMARIRHHASTGPTGTTMLGMIEGARSLGFVAKGVRGGLEALGRVQLPVIAHVVMREGRLHHYVVVYRATPERVVVMDPMDGKVHRIRRDEFEKVWTGVMLLLAPGEQFQTGDERVSRARRFWSVLRPHRAQMLQALAGAVLYTLLGLSTAIYLQKIVDHVFPSGNLNLLNLLSVGMLAVLVLQLLLGISQEFLTLRVGQRIDGQLVLGYFRHLIRLPERFFASHRTGELISRVNDAVRIRAFVSHVLLGFVVNLLIVAFSCALMFLYSWRLALLMMVLLPLYGAIYLLANRSNRGNQRRLMEATAELESQLVESIEASATIKRLRLERIAELRTEVLLVRLLRAVYSSGKAVILSRSAAHFVSRLVTVLLLWVGAAMVLRQMITPGELLSFYALTAYLTGPVATLIDTNQLLHDAGIAGDRLFEVQDLEEEEAPASRARLDTDRMGDIVFDNVGFRYGARGQLFRGLNLVIPRGKMVGIVGESGSGKSTLLSLLQRIEEVQEGSIRIGGLDLRYLSLGSLRSTIGVVPQQVDLFAGNVLENIAIGDLEPDVARVIEISNLLGITEFVEQMPHGFYSQLGPNGAGLSGGQRQRIAVARALYPRPEVLVLDEATSSLDTASERRIQSAIERFRAHDKTLVVIAHRLSTVINADKIVVLQDGSVAEEGTHHELLSRRGVYFRLWNDQFSAPPPAAGQIELRSLAPPPDVLRTGPAEPSAAASGQESSPHPAR